MEFKSRKLKLKFNEQEIELRYPSLSEYKNYQAETGDSNDIEKILTFLEKLGLSKDVSLQFEVTHLETLLSELLGQKKS